MRNVRAAIIGTGFIGRVHARALRVLGIPLAGVVASTPERSGAADRDLGIEHAYRDAPALIQHCDADVIHVCTPNNLHRPLVELAFAAGKHVVCENPLGILLDEASALAALARQSQRVAAMPFAYRYHAMAAEARARARAGTLGRIHLIHGSYLQNWLLSPGEGGWRVDAVLRGQSRAFADIGLRGSTRLAPDAERMSFLPPGHTQGFADCFAALLADVYTATRDGGPDTYPSFNDGLRVAALTDAVLTSARDSTWVKVAS